MLMMFGSNEGGFFVHHKNIKDGKDELYKLNLLQGKTSQLQMAWISSSKVMLRLFFQVGKG